MKATVTSISEARVKRLTNNVVFQIEGPSNTSLGEFTHHCICPFVGKTLLLQISQL